MRGARGAIVGVALAGLFEVTGCDVLFVSPTYHPQFGQDTAASGGGGSPDTASSGGGGTFPSCGTLKGPTSPGGASVGMVLVPAGGFWMGCNGVRDSSCFDDEEPQHAVCLDAFEIDETEVTVAQYAACVDDGGCMNAGDTSEFCNSGESGRSDHPINCVDWDQAKAYCEWAGKRLPTEAEWEKAARGGCELYGDDCKTAMPIYPWGDEEPKCDRATSSGCGDGTRPVWSTPHGASPYLAQDMAGNVWEWVADWNGSYDHGLAMNPSGPSSGAFRVVRGGSFAYGAPYLRASVRYDFSPGYSYGYLGFRCARSVP